MAKESLNNVVLVGSKPIEKYIFAVVAQFKNNKTVKVKARGRNISRAVSVVEATRNKNLVDFKIKNINIGTDVLQTESGERRVSFIEIELER